MKTKILSHGLIFIALLARAANATQTRAQSTYTPYAFTNFAGMPGGPGSADGTGTEAEFLYPTHVAVDSAGNVYVADQANSTIRKMTPEGLVTTVAGSAGQSGSADGVGSAARFNLPGGVAVDSAGNVYVADIYNHRITKGTPGAAADTTPPVI